VNREAVLRAALELAQGPQPPEGAFTINEYLEMAQENRPGMTQRQAATECHRLLKQGYKCDKFRVADVAGRPTLQKMYWKDA